MTPRLDVMCKLISKCTLPKRMWHHLLQVKGMAIARQLNRQQTYHRGITKNPETPHLWLDLNNAKS
jgi:hypothetical protein